MIVQLLGSISCHLSNLISILSEHFWEVHCTAALHACSSTVRVSVCPQTCCCLLKKLFHYLHHYPIYLLHAHFGTQHVTHPCPWVLLALRLLCQASVPGCCGGRWKGKPHPRSNLGSSVILVAWTAEGALTLRGDRHFGLTSSADGRWSFLEAA